MLHRTPPLYVKTRLRPIREGICSSHRHSQALASLRLNDSPEIGPRSEYQLAHRIQRLGLRARLDRLAMRCSMRPRLLGRAHSRGARYGMHHLLGCRCPGRRRVGRRCHWYRRERCRRHGCGRPRRSLDLPAPEGLALDRLAPQVAHQWHPCALAGWARMAQTPRHCQARVRRWRTQPRSRARPVLWPPR